MGKVKRVLEILRRDGFASTVRAAVESYEEKRHDRRLGIDTLRGGELPAEGLTDNTYHNYHFTSYRSFREAMSRAGIVPGESVLLDYGAGKGRVVIFAAEYPFRRVIGLEISPELAGLARRNVERARPKLRCRSIDLVTADATACAVPDDVTHFYLYNPFHGHVLDAVMQRIRESLDRRPRHIRMIFKNPVHFEQEVRNWPWLAKTDEFFHGNKHVIYDAGQP